MTSKKKTYIKAVHGWVNPKGYPTQLLCVVNSKYGLFYNHDTVTL